MTDVHQLDNIKERVAVPRLGKASAVCRLLGGISNPTLEKYVEKGLLPRPISIGDRLRLWDLDALEAMLKSKLAQTASR